MHFVLLYGVLAIIDLTAVDACMPWSYGDWHSWSSCSASCGGGTRKRVRYSCVKNDEDWNTDDCSESCFYSGRYSGGRCHCPSWRSGRCCESCNHVYIPHCESTSQQQCRSNPDNIKCTKCLDPYYAHGWGVNNCKLCKDIPHCDSRHCTTSYDQKCLNCTGDNLIYKRWPEPRHNTCERMCSYEEDYCWPGTCQDQLAKNCDCAQGFVVSLSDSHAKCQLAPNNTPSLMTCHTIITGGNGEKKRTTGSACNDLTDFYGNYQPVLLTFDLLAEFKVVITSSRPNFIHESHFGVTDATVYIRKEPVQGPATIGSAHGQLVDMSSSEHASENWNIETNITLSDLKYNITNGERLCVSYEVKGGGYLKTKHTVTHVINSPVPYQKTTTSKKICYRFDNASPIHCLYNKICNEQPIQIDKRITRSTSFQVSFSGWSDPIPTGGVTSHSSGIQSYEIRILKVPSSKTRLTVDLTAKPVFLKMVNSTVDNMFISLNKSDKPALYCIMLEVKDVADNVQQARRFVLYDNTTVIEPMPDKYFNVSSASRESNFTWQTHHHDICLDWDHYFYNRFYYDNELLNPIEPDRKGLINGVYDQFDGILPIAGTPNIHGIIEYRFSWALNGGIPSNQSIVPNFQNQTYCRHFSVNDGETYTLIITAVDIASNSYEENRTVHIDRSVPHIENMWLRKGDYKTLYVHDDKDMSTMNLYFEAYDPHSGIRNIDWSFGVTDAGHELATGAESIGRINETSCSSYKTPCYCPHVGPCEEFGYSINLNKLMASDKNIGNHNRNYYFTVKVTNNAFLTNIEHIDILVDDSPPEVGVVFEGPVDGPDIDYTSDKDIMVHWHGFIDHESGIKLYRIGLAERCLDTDELSNNLTDIIGYEEVLFTENSFVFHTNHTGKMFVTVVAFNNAMEPSKPACSDGITRDETPPNVVNLVLQNSKWSESIVCMNDTVWLMHSSVAKIKLNKSAECFKHCLASLHDNQMFSAIPELNSNDNDFSISEFMCQKLPTYNLKTIIFLPNDQINLKWNVTEAGSQIYDYFVGFGDDPLGVPNIVTYHSTGRKSYYRRKHEGISRNIVFYIFVKAVNRANLEKVTIYGPIIIDETPPIYRDSPVVKINDQFIIVGWQNDTFYDMEQRSQINQVFFQIEQDSKPVSPLLEWRLDSSKPCSSFSGGCIQYPLKMIQKHDTDFSLQFKVTLFVHNNAGHFIIVNTPNFKLPSRYPPGHALITDIDPMVNATEDVDYHISENTLCARWTGFNHHENLQLEIGVGNISSRDNIIQFSAINSTESHCLSHANILPNTKYFVLLRATCSGGSTVSSSNGVEIINQTELYNALEVHVGEECDSNPNVFEGSYNVSNNIGLTVLIDVQLEVAMAYQLTIEGVSLSDINISTTQGLISHQSSHEVTENMISFIPYTETPTILIKSNKGQISPSDMHLTLQKCARSEYLQLTGSISTNWFGAEGTHLKYEVALMHSNCPNKSIDQSCFDFTTNFIQSENPRLHNFNIQTFTSVGWYRTAVRPCSNVHCLNYVLSKPFLIEHASPSGSLVNAALTSREGGNCHDLNIYWQAFNADSNIILYRWTLAQSESAEHTVVDWQCLVPQGNETLEVHECIQIPVYPHERLFACVLGYSASGKYGTACRQIAIRSPVNYGLGIVYDVDTTSVSWQAIKERLHTLNLGKDTDSIQTNEIDFGNSSTRIAGVVMYGTERRITWYLMTKKQSPYDCSSDVYCLMAETNQDGYIIIKPKFIQMNTFYYICAYSNTTIIKRELFTETLPEMNSCSNGFILDDVHPTSGRVQVLNHNGYLTSTSGILITWSGFKDNVDAKIFGYMDSIKYYSYAVGSRPNGEDIIGFTATGLATVVTIDSIDVTNGAVLYFTVKAYDHAGMSTTKSNEELVVDTTPPMVGELRLNDDTAYSSYVSSDFTLELHGFHDDESGIEYFELAFGNQPGVANIRKGTRYTTDNIYVSLNDIAASDGFTYHMMVKAVNRAGLSSTFVHRAFVVDRSPPTGGHVIDGIWFHKKDVDFQSDIDYIAGHWKGFDDIHSGIEYYNVGLGSRPYTSDVMPMVDVGLRTDMIWNDTFVPGQKYFITVEACNGANLCKKRSSNGIILDNSPPVNGLVRVGSHGDHQTYQPHNSSIHIQWAGYEDPQSGIDHFEACIGTIPFQCDVMPDFNCLLQSNIIKTGLSLPVEKYLYVTVTAFNKVMMKVSESSNSFIIDTTPPVLEQTPSFLTDYTSVSGAIAQLDKSVLRAFWRFRDDESPIVRHIVTLVTHHEGHTPVEHYEMGNDNTLTLNLDNNDRLHNGDKYNVIVTCCNAAYLCTTARSQDILIDSTPPHVGGFKPPLLWNNTGFHSSIVQLTWYGFIDQESGIDMFYLTVSRSYTEHELTNGIVSLHINASLSEYQTRIQLHDAIQPDDELILTIWARNNAGLNSSVARVTVNALSASAHTSKISVDNGILELQKHSCDIHFCNKDCTCAILGQPCVEVKTNRTCTKLNLTDIMYENLPTVEVFGGLTHQKTQISVSSACLSGSWKLQNETFLEHIRRFEFSMGLKGQPVGEGIFDLITTRPWQDVGKRQENVWCLTGNNTLIHDESYIVYVRAWYDNDRFSQFESNAIQIDHTPPHVRRGAFIKDSDLTCRKDLDFIDWTENITACWERTFSEVQGKIIHFTVGLGTSPGFDDVVQVQNVGLQTSKSFRDLHLSHGIQYYFTVVAYNNVGLHTTLTSDGFVVDNEPPVAGVVFNTERHTDSSYQTSNTTFSLSWHGFVDHHSGIKSYYVALGEHDIDEPIVNFTNVGLLSHYTFKNLTLEQGKLYQAFVKASDAAGHFSNATITRKRTIDTTPPEGFICTHFYTLSNITATLTGQRKVVSFSNDMTKNIFYKISGKVDGKTTDTRALLSINRFHLRLPMTINHDSSQEFQYSFLSPLSGHHELEITFDSAKPLNVQAKLSTCAQDIQNNSSVVEVVQIGTGALAVTINIKDNESYITKVLVGAGTTKGGFQVQALKQIHGGNSGIIRADVQTGAPVYVTVLAENGAGLRSLFYAEPITMDKTAPVISKVNTVMNMGDNSNDTNSSSIPLVTSWRAIDTESGIKVCYCAAGSRNGVYDLSNFVMPDKPNACTFSDLSLSHGMRVYTTVRCVNNVELFNEVTSEPFIIEYQPPVSDHASVQFISLNQRNLPSHKDTFTLQQNSSNPVHVQTNGSSVLLEWEGFEDMAKVDHYEYRLLQNDQPYLDWVDSAQKTCVSVDGLKLKDTGLYTAEVRALNSEDYVSIPVKSLLFIQNKEPRLTGKSMTITRTGQSFHLDWLEVFDVVKELPVTYSLVIGSQAMYTDILQKHYVTATHYNVDVPKTTIITKNVNEIYFTITCSYSIGLSSTYRTSYKI